MAVHLNPDLQAKLSRLAAEQGRDTEGLVREAIERLVDYDEWFLREVEKGLAARRMALQIFEGVNCLAGFRIVAGLAAK